MLLAHSRIQSRFAKLLLGSLNWISYRFVYFGAWRFKGRQIRITEWDTKGIKETFPFSCLFFWNVRTLKAISNVFFFFLFHFKHILMRYICDIWLFSLFALEWLNQFIHALFETFSNNSSAQWNHSMHDSRYLLAQVFCMKKFNRHAEMCEYYCNIFLLS